MNLIDGVRPGVTAGVSLTIEEGRIAEISARGGAGPAGAQVIDLAGGYLLPGLWDVHVHLEWPRLATADVAELTVQYAANAAQGPARVGRDVHSHRGNAALHRRGAQAGLSTGRLVGPRIFAGGWFLTTTAGHALGTGFARTCDGPTGFVRAIREQMENGVDHVKLNLSGGIFGPSWDRHWHSFLLDRGAGGGLRDLPPARLPGDGARDQPRCREGGGEARRAQRRARLHHGRRVPHAVS